MKSPVNCKPGTGSDYPPITYKSAIFRGISLRSNVSTFFRKLRGTGTG